VCGVYAGMIASGLTFAGGRLAAVYGDHWTVEQEEADGVAAAVAPVVAFHAGAIDPVAQLHVTAVLSLAMLALPRIQAQRELARTGGRRAAHYTAPAAPVAATVETTAEPVPPARPVVDAGYTG
jgi:hypothetical protein